MKLIVFTLIYMMAITLHSAPIEFEEAENQLLLDNSNFYSAIK